MVGVGASLLLFCVHAQLAAGFEFYPYGPAYDSQLPQENDISSMEIPLAVPIKFFGESYSSIFVNSNGLLSFLTEIPIFFSIQFPLNYPIIAPLYANVDISGRGQIYYRETQDPQLLQTFNDKVQRFYPRLPTAFTARSLFIASWIEVGYFPSKVDKINTFQVVVASDGTETFVELLYRQGGVQWVQGQTQSSGLPDARAQAGFVAEDGRLYTLRGSGTDQIQNLDRWGNTDESGVWLFRVGNIGSTGNVEPPQVNYGDNDNLIEQTSCQTGAPQCHSQATCVDMDEGYCCICQSSYYGNGRTCLQDQIPLRVNGKINISLNNVPAQEADVQAYIVTADGRCYTALSRVPPSIGTDAQLITSTADIIGWLFAKSINDAPNGYELSGGVLNHTAVLTFGNGQHRVTVDQRFLGLDVFDQLRMEGQIVGTIPLVPHGARLSLPDSQVQYRKSSPGVIKSHSSFTMFVEDSLEQFPISVDQTIVYTEHCPSNSPDGNLRLKAARNFISYEERENIVRFAATNKISSQSDNDDPCVVGQVSCVNNSHCIPEGSTFRCVCNSGFQTLYSDEAAGDYGCVDINECQSGSHSCDENALCINEVGSFSCQCRQGYTGNGYTCHIVYEDCSSVRCNPGAECIETQLGPSCRCIPGFIGNGTVCTPNAEDDCLICSPHAFCNRTQSGAVQCTCLQGFTGDGKECSQADDTIIRTCVLGICLGCPTGYIEHGQLCVRDHNPPVTTVPPTDSDSDDGGSQSCNILNNCHPQAQCVYLSAIDSYQCQCNAGFEGNGYDCSEIEMSCNDSDICHLYATCVEDASGRHICVCDDGFQGDGTNCYKSEICSEDVDCGDHAVCVWSEETQRRDCECERGYIMDYKLCVKQGCEECHQDAECVTNPVTGLPGCICKFGLVGDGVTRCEAQDVTGCNLLHNCAPDADCIFVPEAGYRCQCHQGYEGSGLECRLINNCQNNPSLCSDNARCVPTNSGFECQCNAGFVGNGQTCREIRPMEGGFLLVNRGMATMRIPLEPNKSNPGRPIQLDSEQTAIGLAVDCVEGLVYWSDISSHVIKSSELNGKHIKNFVDSDISSPEGLAVDWMSRKLYWTDSGRDVVRAASLESGVTETIVSTGLVNPRGIAVHPIRRKIYWSDWNRAAPKLETSNLDGSGREVLVREGVKLPNSLAIDWNTNELCWTDAGIQQIECIGIDSGIRRTVVSNCSYPFGLAITADKYYWTDWQTQKVESAWKFSSSDRDSLVVPLEGAGKLYGIAATSDFCPRI